MANNTGTARLTLKDRIALVDAAEAAVSGWGW